jgi:hypothetical protein
MPPRKIIAPEPTRVRVRVITSFNEMRQGDEAEIEINSIVQGWINAGLVVIVDGTSPAGPGGAEPDAHGGDPKGAPGGVTPGGEPGEGFGTGAYGSAPIVDQG